MTFDPASTNVKFFIRRIRMVAQQEGVHSVLNVLPFCLKGRALTWHTELPDDIQDEMAYSLHAWIRALDNEFTTDLIKARRDARHLHFYFSRADDMPLAEYLIQKVSLLRAAGTTDQESIKSELWEGLDDRLASLVPPSQTESLEQFKQRIRANEASARRLWESKQFISKYRSLSSSKEDRLDRLLSKLGGRAHSEDTPGPERPTDDKKQNHRQQSVIRPDAPHWSRTSQAMSPLRRQALGQ
jgi:hypothetical protein